ncbi:unnamed protein product [Boreogadus saida]
MFSHHREREQPFFSARAHVFQIDPSTKRNWIPASKHAVTVSFFYDANRNVYRIISVGGTKAIINCSITPSMTFTKTSQKFGQWADSRANTVYGLGFATEQQLHQFSEKFKEVKDAARLARDKSQDKELANTALSIAAPQVSVAHFTPTMAPFRGSRLLCTSGFEGKEWRAVSDLARLGQRPPSLGCCLHQTGPEDCGAGSTQGPPRRPINKEQSPLGYTRLLTGAGPPGLSTLWLNRRPAVPVAPSTTAPLADLSDELQSPPVMCINGPEDKLFRSQSADITLSSEKERIKKMLSEGSICEMNLEAELFTLQDSNNKLVAALHEANANVEQWKKQLAAYQEETERLRDQVSELETHGGHGPSDLLKDELTQSLEELEALLKAKDEEIHILQNKKLEYHEMERDRDEAMHRLQEMEMRNSDLERRVQNSEQNLNNSLEERDRTDNEIQRSIEILDIKIFDLNDLRQSLVKLIDK